MKVWLTADTANGKNWRCWWVKPQWSEQSRIWRLPESYLRCGSHGFNWILKSKNDLPKIPLPWPNGFGKDAIVECELVLDPAEPTGHSADDIKESPPSGVQAANTTQTKWPYEFGLFLLAVQPGGSIQLEKLL